MVPASMLGTLGRDLRYGVRGLLSKPGFAIIAIATLALGIGANTAMFSVVNAVILTPLALPQPDRVVMVWTDKVSGDVIGLPASIPDFLDWRATGMFDELAGFDTEGYNLVVGTMPERVPGVAVTKEWFDILRAQPVLGRTIGDDDIQAGHDQVVVLSYGLWNSLFKADPGVVGRVITVNGSPRTIIGVLPDRVAKLADEKLYVPLLFQPPQSTNRGLRWIATVGRLTPGISLRAAQATLAAVSTRLQKEFPQDNAGYHARLEPIETAYVGDMHNLLLVLFAAVGFVLLVACANIGNLLLVRGAARERELAIRVALGAGRFRLIRQLLTESLLLALLGGAAGLLPAWLGIHLLERVEAQTLPNSSLISLNPRVLAFTLLLALCAGLFFGILPALEAWRDCSLAATREHAPASTRLRFGNLFVMGELALTVILVTGAMLMLRSFARLRSAYPGYDVHTLTMRLSLAGKEYDDPEKQIAFYKHVVTSLATLPGLRSVGAIDCLPSCTDVVGGTLHFADRPDPPPSDPALVIVGLVTPDYFRAMGIPLIRGRAFSSQDGEHDTPTVILDAETADRFWPHQDPIGRNVRLRSKWPWRRIVGVVGSVNHTLAVQMKSRIGQAYVPATQMPTPDMSLVIASSLSPSALIPLVRSAIGRLAPDVPVFQIQTMDQANAGNRLPSMMGTALLGSFAALSLLLAFLGVYGVISFAVQQRTREIGVRMAAGATRQDVLFLMLRRESSLTLIGLGLGVGGSLVATSAMKDLLPGLTAADPLSLLSTVLLLFLAAFLASFIPAWRASRVQPMTALRYE